MVQIFQPSGHPYGLHRVKSPADGTLPVAAEALELSLPIYDNEILVHVDTLQLDAASFTQLMTSRPDGMPTGQPHKEGPLSRQVDESTSQQAIKEQITQIVSRRGKMHNPVTNSGGMLLGTVEQIGPKHAMSRLLKEGDRIASLVSLTLTPLTLREIHKVDLHTHQIAVDGHALFFQTGILAKIPSDISEKVTVAALDICGAPAQVARVVQPQDRVLILGLGKAGRCCAVVANQIGAHVWGVDISQESVDWCRQHVLGTYEAIGADKCMAIMEWIQSSLKLHPHLPKEAYGFGDDLPDVVIQCSTGEGAEMASILACRNGGKILFFGMNTSFQRAALGAEGVGKDVAMMIGNGYVPGHDELMLNLLRKHPGLRQWFEEKYGK